MKLKFIKRDMSGEDNFVSGEDDVNKSGDASDNSTKNDNLGTSELNLSFGNTLYLQPNDTCDSPIVTIELIRTKNYKMWSIAMTFTLKYHNKLGLVDGTCKRDSKNPLLANQWDMCNSMVVSWILNSLSPDLFNIISLNQNGSTLAEYYNNLNSRWKTFDAMISLPPCTCDAVKHFEEHNQLINLIQFLTGLDESYLEIRSNILTREALPLVKEAFAVVSGEESHKNATSVGDTKPTLTTFAAKNFDNKRRLVILLIDVLSLLVILLVMLKRNFSASTKPVSSNNDFADVHSNNATTDTRTSNSRVSLSSDQLARIMSLLNDNGFSSDNANMAGKYFKNLKGTFLMAVLGHPANQVLDVLKSAVNLNSHSVSDHLCDTCNKAKQTKEPFPLDGFRYFLTIVDDYSRAVWVYMLKGKDDVYDSIDVYMTIPQGFSDNNNKNKVCKLVKSLYGLQQAPKKWNEKLVSVLKENSFLHSANDHSLFTKSKNNKFIALLVYVNDIIFNGNCVNEIDQFKIFLKSKDLGNLKYFLGIEVLKL
ncbi:ribonuclease H-like domain-containing protein [Tanacetum coccineum]|uniref:Ribonuclease H-like domain-containing protein n=1 Tax=Tanacetum coccineum TaxID=301880 RepID=A0ABQ4Y669_9ASTR